MPHVIEVFLTYEVDSGGEAEDVVQRLIATSPTTMDVQDKYPEPSTQQAA